MIAAFWNLVHAAIAFAYHLFKWAVYLALFTAFLISSYGQRAINAACEATTLCLPNIERLEQFDTTARTDPALKKPKGGRR